MSLGVCCHWVRWETSPRSGVKKLVNEFDERTLQLGRYRSGKYTSEQIAGVYEHNVKNLIRMLPKISNAGVKLFRISSSMFPLADQVDSALWNNQTIRNLLSQAGSIIKDNDMRVSTHPGQFCVLSSDSEAVVEKAVVELNIHGWMFDMMGLDRTPKYAINIHGGKSQRADQLADVILRLPDNIRSRLTLENDEMAYSVIDLLDVYKKTGTPIVFDSHHHVFNTGELTLEEAFSASVETWHNGIIPLQHISNTDPSLVEGSFSDRRKHSDMIHYVPEVQLNCLKRREIDVDVEAKHKNFAVFNVAEKFDIPV